MRPGDLVDGRFELVREAGAGGMGIVFQATDRRDGELVALKMLTLEGAANTSRFMREAEVLSQLSHPAIVGYVAHGATPSPWLAMRWLEGEDLSQRLGAGRGPLAIDLVLSMGTKIAEAVGFAHERGFVHRDLKPSNVFIEANAPDAVKLLDFGLARELVAPAALTATGIVLGTVGYLSPEQARGSPNVDARSDVFAMGCILFECLTGRPAFTGDHVVATLAKLLVEEVPRVRTLRPDAPSALDSLVARMLDKKPEARPRDGAEVARVLASIRSHDTSSIGGPTSLRPSSLTGTEQRVMAVILVGHPLDLSDGSTGGDGGAATIISLRTPAARALIDDTMKRFFGHADIAADGTVVVTMRVAGSATDQAAQAARCALALREACPGASLALAVGRGVAMAGVAAGEVIERAAALLASAQEKRSEGIHIEPAVATLLDDRFVVAVGAHHMLHAERSSFESARVLLGRVTPFVGRAKELSTLEQTLTESILDGVASVTVVVAGPGAGKTRLLEELLRNARRRHPEAATWLARADAMRSQSAFGVVATLLRSATGIAESAPVAAQHERLLATVAEIGVEAGSRERVAQFLAEAMSCPFDGDASVQLRAARQSSALMGDQIMRAWVDLVGASLSRPTLIVVEDLHWADAPSTKLLDAMLRAHPHKKLMLVAMGRPELEERFPSLWVDRGAQTLRLNPLSPRAAMQLAREALGAGVDDATVVALAERSAGNPFVLEELVRASKATGGAELPDSVLALVQTRLEALDPSSRRALRAASVFGRVVPAEGVVRLLGEDAAADVVYAALRELVREEVLEPRLDSTRGPGAVASSFTFRHDLVREAAYAMLTEQDRTTGHALAGDWLLANGELDAGLLAKHFDRGGEVDRAVGCYVRAAEQALDASDLGTVSERAKRAIQLGATGELLGRAELSLAFVGRWSGAYDGVVELATHAAALLSPGSRLWFQALHVVVLIGDITHRSHERSTAVDLAASTDPVDAAAASARLGVMVSGAMARFHVGEYDLGCELSDRVEREAEALIASDPYVAAVVWRMKSSRSALSGDTGASLVQWTRVIELFDAAGERRAACVARINCGFAMMLLGLNEDAERALRQGLADGLALELADAIAAARHNLGLVLARRGAFQEAAIEELAALEEFRARGNARMIGASEVYASMILQSSGDLKGAELHARNAVLGFEPFPPSRPSALAQLASVLLDRGSLDEALEVAEVAMKQMLTTPVDDGEALVRLVYARALLAKAQGSDAARVLKEAMARLHHRADLISDASLRESFLRRVPENARTFALAAELGLSAT